MPVLVQQVSGTGTGTTLTLTLPGNTTAGNCLSVAAGAAGNSVGTITAVTLGGAAGNFAKAAGTTNTGTDAEIWTDQNCAGGQNSVAITISTLISGEIFATVYEHSGVVTSSAVDQTSTGTSTSAAFSSGATAATTVANEAWIGAVAEVGASTITGPSSPWVNSALLGATTKRGLTGSQLVTSTGAATYAGTLGATSQNAAVVVTLKGTAANTAAGGLALPPLNMAGAVTVANPVTTAGAMALAVIRMSGTVAEQIASSGSMGLAVMKMAGTAAVVYQGTGGLSLAPLAMGGAGLVAPPVTCSGGLALQPLAMRGTAATIQLSCAGGLRLAPLAMIGVASEGTMPGRPRPGTPDSGSARHRIWKRCQREGLCW